MEIKTSLASGIDVTKDKTDYDAVCKRLLSEKIILAWIMKSCLEEFRDVDVNVIAEQCIEGQPIVSEVPVAPDETAPVIQGIAQEQSSPTEGKVTFDIYFNAIVPGTEEIVQLIINVEAQLDFYPGYPILKRGVFYCGRMLSAQAGTVFTKSHYEKLRKVYSIWLCTNPPKSMENTITCYQMTESSLVGDVHAKPEDYDLLSVVMLCLGGEDGQNYSGVLKLLGVLLSSKATPAEKKQILQDEFNIPMTQTMDREVSLMCNLSEGVWRDGWKDGMEKGIEKGIEKGEAHGIEKGILASVQNLMRNTSWPIEKALSVLEVPKDEWKRYSEKLMPQ